MEDETFMQTVQAGKADFEGWPGRLAPPHPSAPAGTPVPDLRRIPHFEVKDVITSSSEAYRAALSKIQRHCIKTYRAHRDDSSNVVDLLDDISFIEHLAARALEGSR